MTAQYRRIKHVHLIVMATLTMQIVDETTMLCGYVRNATDKIKPGGVGAALPPGYPRDTPG